MLDNYEEYEEFVKDITRTVPLIKTEQLKLMIANYFNQPLELMGDMGERPSGSTAFGGDCSLLQRVPHPCQRQQDIAFISVQCAQQAGF